MSHRRLFVVIDDNHRWALHLRQHLAGNLGFGIGAVHRSKLPVKGPVHWEAGDAGVWWIDADDEWRASLDRFVALVGEDATRKAQYLVDVVGRVDTYDAKEVLTCLRGLGVPEPAFIP